MIPPVTKVPEGFRDPKLHFDTEDASVFAPPYEPPPWRDEDELMPDEVEEHWNP
jgi:hypothetical protein